MICLRVVFLCVALAVAPALARSSGHGHSHSKGSRTKCASCARDKRGHIKRNPEAKRAFKNSHPCPSSGRSSGACPGYVVDHIKPLKREGADSPSNMQWQTKAEARAKDRVED